MAPPTDAPHIQVVFFDMGGTLAHPHPSFHALIADVCQVQGLPITTAQVEEAEPAVWERVRARADAGRGFSMSPDVSREFWIWVYQTFLEELGHQVEARTNLPERMLETFLRLESYSLYDDVLPVLDRLHGAGLKLGVISNWEEWLERLIVHLEIGHYFDVVAVSGTFGVEKPEGAIFRYALEAADAVPEDAVHIGDSFGDDVLGAASVGIRPILLDRENRGFPLLPSQGGELPKPVARVQSLLEVPGLLGLE